MTRRSSLFLYFTFALVLVTMAVLLMLGLRYLSNDCPTNESESNFPACSRTFKVPTPALVEAPAIASPVDTGVAATEMERISSKEADPQSNYSNQTHAYSRRQAWNSDESLIALSDSIIDAETFEVLVDEMRVSSYRNWSNLNPDVMRGIVFDPKQNVLSEWNVRTEEFKTVHRFDEYERCSLGEGEGNFSNDDRYIVLVCEGTEIGDRTLISYDAIENKILGKLKAQPDLNWASFSQSGKFIVVENSREGGPTYKLYRYSPELTEQTLLYTHPEHGDLGLDTNGEDVFVMIDWDTIHYVRLRDGLKVTLPVSGGSDDLGYGHISCRNLQRPGWCYVSSSGNKTVGAVKIGLHADGLRGLLGDTLGHHFPQAAYEHWGFHHASYESYASNAKGSVSPSGRQMIVSSDWGQTAPVSSYIIRIRPNSGD